VLGISRRTIQYRLQEWGLSRPTKSGRSEAGEGGANEGGERGDEREEPSQPFDESA
jgi:hypothetical protein